MPASGFLIIDKPEGITSRRVTDRVRKILDEKKAGHLGTLDPMATGVLPVAVGKGTRLIPYLEGQEKTYLGTVTLGRTTDTQDRTGNVIDESPVPDLDISDIEEALECFRGEIEQVPPMHSAIKKDGRPLYELARKGVEVTREPRVVTVFEIELKDLRLPDIVIRVRCSPGTYIRTIANDLGSALGCGAHLSSLRRLGSGLFTLDMAVPLEGLERDAAERHIISMMDSLPDLGLLEVSGEQATRLKNGLQIQPETACSEEGELLRISCGEELVAIGKCQDEEGEVSIKPLKVFI